MKKLLLTLGLVLMSTVALAVNLLPVDQAFQLSANLQKANVLSLNFMVAPGYHLYKEHIHVETDNKQVKLGKIDFPAWQLFNDGIAKFKVYEGSTDIHVPFTTKLQKPFEVRVLYQGCSDKVCYPPVTKHVLVNLKTGEVSLSDNSLTLAKAKHKKRKRFSTEQSHLKELLEHSNLSIILLTFFGLGVLLTFTPCVLPMIPIISGLIVGQEVRTLGRAFRLSLAYVLTMALTYAVLGMLAASAGGHLQAALQSPAVIITFSAFFVVLAFSLFGYYELRLPSAFEQKITALSNKQQGGSYLGVIIMGFLATLIVSPCVSAPLVAALGFIAQTGNTLLGGAALFSLGLGMGLPLLLIGTTSGKLLPKAGQWMETVKHLFGILLLATALWLFSRLLSAFTTMMLWGILLIISAICMGALETKHEEGILRFAKALAFFALFWGCLIVVGGLLGGKDPLLPINPTMLPANSVLAKSELHFKRIKTRAELDATLEKAARDHQPVMLDFYADWCAACKVMEEETFSDPRVKQALAGYLLVRADVTANDKQDKSLQDSLGVIAPPTVLFFDKSGDEVDDARVVGETGPAKFLEHIKAATS